MQRGEVWWARLPSPAGRRPVVLVSRDRAIQVRDSVTIVQITGTVRNIPVEVPLGTEDGLSKRCVANCDVIVTIPKEFLEERITRLSAIKQDALNEALRFSLDLA